MIYTAARQKSRRLQAPAGACSHFSYPSPAPQSQPGNNKTHRQNRRNWNKTEKNARHSEQFGNKLFIYK